MFEDLEPLLGVPVHVQELHDRSDTHVSDDGQYVVSSSTFVIESTVLASDPDSNREKSSALPGSSWVGWAIAAITDSASTKAAATARSNTPVPVLVLL